MISYRLSLVLAIVSNLLCSVCIGQDTNMVLRTYPVRRDLIEVIVDNNTYSSTNDFVEMGEHSTSSEDVQDFFKRAGLPFPNGSFMRYVSALNHLVMRNTVENQRMLCRLLSYPRPTQVQVDVTLARTHNLLPFIQNGTVLTSSHLASIPSDDVVVIDSCSVTTRSGVNAISQRQGYTATNTNQMLEATLNVTPTVGADGKSMDVTLVWTSTRPSNVTSLTKKDHITTSVVVSDGVPLVLLARRSYTDECLEFAILTATLINERGEKIQYTPEGYRIN